jgi:hypothetical protein
LRAGLIEEMNVRIDDRNGRALRLRVNRAGGRDGRQTGDTGEERAAIDPVARMRTVHHRLLAGGELSLDGSANDRMLAPAAMATYWRPSIM